MCTCLRVRVCMRVPMHVGVHVRVFSIKACFILVLVSVRRPPGPWQLRARLQEQAAPA